MCIVQVPANITMNDLYNSDTQTSLSTCPRDCYDACGLKVMTEKGKVIQVVGDPEHPVSKGRLCKKCSIGYNSIWIDEEARVTQPLRRTGKKGKGAFEAVSWDTAIGEISSRLKDILQSSGAESILSTHYTGTFAAIGYHFPIRFSIDWAPPRSTRTRFATWPAHVALDYVYGSSMTGFDPRTSKDSECILVWGGNPSTAGPHTNEHWLEPQAEKLIVVDPIRTPSAAMATLHPATLSRQRRRARICDDERDRIRGVRR